MCGAALSTTARRFFQPNTCVPISIANTDSMDEAVEIMSGFSYFVEPSVFDLPPACEPSMRLASAGPAGAAAELLQAQLGHMVEAASQGTGVGKP